MKECDLDDAIATRNYRRNCMKLKDAAQSGFLELKIGGFDDPSSHISLECVRRAIADECDREIASYEEKLKIFGIEV